MFRERRLERDDSIIPSFFKKDSITLRMKMLNFTEEEIKPLLDRQGKIRGLYCGLDEGKLEKLEQLMKCDNLWTTKETEEAKEKCLKEQFKTRKEKKDKVCSFDEKGIVEFSTSIKACIEKANPKKDLKKISFDTIDYRLSCYEKVLAQVTA